MFDTVDKKMLMSETFKEIRTVAVDDRFLAVLDVDDVFIDITDLSSMKKVRLTEVYQTDRNLPIISDGCLYYTKRNMLVCKRLSTLDEVFSMPASDGYNEEAVAYFIDEEGLTVKHGLHQFDEVPYGSSECYPLRSNLAQGVLATHFNHNLFEGEA